MVRESLFSFVGLHIRIIRQDTVLQEHSPFKVVPGILNIGCGAAQLVVRRLAVRQARVRISSRHPMEAPLAERRRDEDSRRRASANGEG
jgi:hypothetical protein